MRSKWARSWPLMYALLVLLAAPALVALRPAEDRPDTVEWPVAEFREPSGIVYHAARGSLFIVGDEGDIGEVSVEGRLLRQAHIGGDLEAITVDARSGLLYVVREGQEVILEVRPDDFKLLRRFTIDRSYQGDPNYLRRGGDGVEGLTFVPDDDDPEGGKFWVVNQYDPPVLVELAIPLRSTKDKYEVARIVRAIPVDGAPLSEVTWDPGGREFLIVSALWKRITVLDAAGTYERSVHIPGFMPEGIARLPGGRFVIAQDSGGLVLWTPAAEPFHGEAATAPADEKTRAPALLPATAPVAAEAGAAAPPPDSSAAGRHP